MRRLGIMIAVLATLALPALADASDVQVGRFNGGPPAGARPATLGIGAKGVVSGIAWESWNGPTATGRGVYDIAGFAGQPGTGYNSATGLAFSGRRSCGSSRVYTTLTLTLDTPMGDGSSTLTLTDFTKCSSARPSITRRCGHLGYKPSSLYVSNVRATRTSCSIARRVASTWRTKPGCGQLPPGGPTTCSKILGYACTRIAGSGEALVYRCRNADRSVRFDAGA